MDGELKAEISANIKTMGLIDDATCATCIAGCCGWFLCNPACLVACVAGVCKN